MSPRLAACRIWSAASPFAPGAPIRHGATLEVHEPEAQPGERRHDQRQQRQQSSELLSRFVILKTASRPWRSVPQPTASRAAAKILFNYCVVASIGRAANCRVKILFSGDGNQRLRQAGQPASAARAQGRVQFPRTRVQHHRRTQIRESVSSVWSSAFCNCARRISFRRICLPSW